MVEIDEWRFEPQSDRLYFHFDVSEHFLKLDTFIRTADSARKIIDSFNEDFFHGELEYELIVLPPKSGTFLSELAIYVMGGTTGLFAFINTEVGAVFVEGLTGKPPTHWSKRLGERTRKLIEDTKSRLSAEEPKLLTLDESSGPPPAMPSDDVEDEEQEKCRVGAEIVTEMTRGALEKDTDRLRKIGADGERMADAMNARGDFYHACYDNPEVKRVGFTPEDKFPVPRSSFAERAQKLERQEKEEEATPWAVAVENIFVSSPNWEREDQQARQWKGKDTGRRDCYFIIEDDEFWTHVKKKDLTVVVNDNLKVQWAFQIDGRRIKNRRVLRVLEYNGEKLADPLNDDVIRALLGQFSDAEMPPASGDLFEDPNS